MTRDAFEQQYAAGSGVTVDWLHQMGQYAAPCGPEYGCDDEGCQGWQMQRSGRGGMPPILIVSEN